MVKIPEKIYIYMIVTTLCLSAYLGYTFLVSNKDEEAKIIQLIDYVFDIDISDSEFTYENTLNPIKEGGDLKVQVSVDKETAEAWMKSSSALPIKRWKYHPVFSSVSELTGIAEEELTGEIAVHQFIRTVRKVPLGIPIFKDNRDIQFAYFQSAGSEAVTVYMMYTESESGLHVLVKLVILFIICLIVVSNIGGIVYLGKHLLYNVLHKKTEIQSNKKTKRRIVACLLLLFMILNIFMLYRYFTSEERRRQEAIEIILLCFGVNISDEVFTYEYSLQPLTAGGELLVQVSLDEEKAKIWVDWFEKTCMNDEMNDFSGRVMSVTGLDREALDGKIFVAFESDTVRAVRLVVHCLDICPTEIVMLYMFNRIRLNL